jgi:hypothetical protein
MLDHDAPDPVGPVSPTAYEDRRPGSIGDREAPAYARELLIVMTAFIGGGGDDEVHGCLADWNHPDETPRGARCEGASELALPAKKR